MPKHCLFLFQKRFFNDLVLPGFDHMLTLSVWIWGLRNGSALGKVYGSFLNICNTQISRYLVSKNRLSLKMGTVRTDCPILNIVILKQNPRFSFMEWASF